MFANTVLNSTVANQTLNSVGNGPISGSHKTREDDRFEMWCAFVFGLTLAIGYSMIAIFDETNGFIDFCYLMFYIVCLLGVSMVSLDEKQSKKAIKTSLILTSVLSLGMLVPFVCDMNYNIMIPLTEVYSCRGGKTEHFVLEYCVDIPQIIGIVFMYILLLCCSLSPLMTLRNMNKSV